MCPEAEERPAGQASKGARQNILQSQRKASHVTFALTELTA